MHSPRRHPAIETAPYPAVLQYLPAHYHTTLAPRGPCARRALAKKPEPSRYAPHTSGWAPADRQRLLAAASVRALASAHAGRQHSNHHATPSPLPCTTHNGHVPAEDAAARVSVVIIARACQWQGQWLGRAVAKAAAIGALCCSCSGSACIPTVPSPEGCRECLPPQTDKHAKRLTYTCVADCCCCSYHRPERRRAPLGRIRWCAPDPLTHATHPLRHPRPPTPSPQACTVLWRDPFMSAQRRMPVLVQA